jgi:hypothetical protein
MSLTGDEYEDAYREALLCLSRVVSVGAPFVNENGSRNCTVNAKILDDEAVLRLFWGETITAEILALRGAPVKRD